MAEGKISIALLLDDESVQQWGASALEVLERETDIEVKYLIIDDSETPEFTRRIQESVLGEGIWGLYIASRWIVRRTHQSGGPTFKAPIPVERIECLSGAERIRCTPIQSGVWNELPKPVTSKLSEVDVAIRFGFGLIKGDVLTAPKYGVLSFHHGDLREYRGPPAGFWEYVHGKETAGVTVQRLNESIDGGEVAAFRPVNIGNAETWREVQHRLFEASTPMLATAIERVQHPESLETPDNLGEYYGRPGLGAFLTYLTKSCTGRIRSAFG